MPEAEYVASLGTLTILGSGGQGTVYAVLERLINDSWPAAYKEFEPSVRAAVNASALTAMVRLLDDLPADPANRLGEIAAWPATLVERDGRLSGFLMRLAPEEFLTEVRFPSGRSRRLAKVQLLLNDDGYLAARGLRTDDRFRLELLHDTAGAIELFHGLGIVVGDLSPDNLLFSRERRPRCFFLDCDAMRLRGASVLRQAETVDWEAPAGAEELATPATDSYKFALLCIRLFAGDQSARSPAAVGRAGPAVRVLAERALSIDPRRRPDMRQWRRALATALATYRERTPPPPRTASAAPRAWWGVGAVLAAIVVLLIAALGSCTTWLQNTAATLGGDRARVAEQASGVAQVLADSGNAHTRVAAAIDGVATCTDVRSAGADLRAGSVSRRASLERTAALHTDLLPNGAALKVQLTAALEHARQADDAYAAWAAAVETKGCGSPAMRGAERREGDAQSNAAAAAGKRFAQLWNPLAARYGHPQVSGQDI